MTAIPERDFTVMLNALAEPRAFPLAFAEEDHIEVIQTHASAVLLTPTRVYKLKKPKDFGFFDYSTPTLRRRFCQQEVLLNADLAPQVYLGVAPVLTFPDDHVRFGPTFSPIDVPPPATLIEGGYVVDYAVVMVRLPDEATLESRVRLGTATTTLLGQVARFIARFHATAATNDHISSFGGTETICNNWQENFQQMKPYLGRVLDPQTDRGLVDYVHRFLRDRSALFEDRVRMGRIRDCHGDLRLQHVYILDKPAPSGEDGPRILLLDRIEFNERFRYGDVASEIAFLTMELDALSRPDLSRAFINAYIEESGDETIRELLSFYCCYRAYVRGKVLSFQLDEPEVAVTQQEEARQAARLLFALAAHYATGQTQPLLIMVGGLMGTGKSTLTLALQQELGCSSFSSDAVRKQLACVDPTQPQASAFGQGIYDAHWTQRTYWALAQRAHEALISGHSVLLDATFLRSEYRRMMVQEARATGASAVFVECRCPRGMVLKRLAVRWAQRVEGQPAAKKLASQFSDGRPELYDAQHSQWEEVSTEEEEQGMQHIVIDSTLPLSLNLECVAEALHLPRFVCWL